MTGADVRVVSCKYLLNKQTLNIKSAMISAGSFSVRSVVRRVTFFLLQVTDFQFHSSRLERGAFDPNIIKYNILKK